MRQRIGRKEFFVPIALPHIEEAIRRSDSGKSKNGGLSCI